MTKATPFYSGLIGAGAGEVSLAFNPEAANVAAQRMWKLATLQEHGRHEFDRLRRLEPARTLA